MDNIDKKDESNLNLVEELSEFFNNTTGIRIVNYVKLRRLSQKNDKYVYGITIPRHIAAEFLNYQYLKVEKSGTGIILTGYDKNE